MLIYSIFYYDAKTGRRLKEFDRDCPGIKRAPVGTIAKLTCENGSRDESYEVDEHGIMKPFDYATV